MVSCRKQFQNKFSDNCELKIQGLILQLIIVRNLLLACILFPFRYFKTATHHCLGVDFFCYDFHWNTIALVILPWLSSFSWEERIELIPLHNDLESILSLACSDLADSINMRTN